MEKSHRWIDAVKAKCPYCCEYDYYIAVGDEDDIVKCSNCHKDFELGEQE